MILKIPTDYLQSDPSNSLVLCEKNQEIFGTCSCKIVGSQPIVEAIESHLRNFYRMNGVR